MLRKIAIALSATTALATPLAAQTASVPVDPKMAAQVRAILLEHPEYIFEAAAKGQQKQREAQVAQQAEKINPVRAEIFAKKSVGPVIGNPNGTTTVVELLDYACPFCKRAHDMVDKIAAERKDTRFVILMRPVLGPESEILAKFALAANMQGKFQATHDALYEKFGDDHQTHATDDNLKAVADKVGLDFERAKKDMNSDAVVKMMEQHKGFGDRMEVNGTPFFVTEKTIIPGFPQTEQNLLNAMAK